jgi:2-oxoglutarate ferredoxin oxidoreductase subunit alpha
MDRLLRKHKEAARLCARSRDHAAAGARVGVITLGGCDPAVREALDILEEQGNRRWTTCVLRGFPFDERWSRSSPSTILLMWWSRIATRSCAPADSRNAGAERQDSTVLVYGGFPLSAKNVLDAIRRAGGGARCHLSLNRAWRIPAWRATKWA